MSEAVTDLKSPIAKLAANEHLSADEAQAAFNVIMSGDATPAQIGGFLMALRVNGENVDEITGAARAMRAKCAMVKAPANAMDVVGTGYVPQRLGENYARAKAPVRLSLSGGGTDFTDYFMKFGGISLTAATNRHSHAVLRRICLP